MRATYSHWASFSLLVLFLALPLAHAQEEEEQLPAATEGLSNEETIEQITETLRQRPDYAWGYYTRALARSNIGDHEGAKVDFIVASQLDSNLKIPARYLQEIQEEAAEESGSVIGRIMGLFNSFGN